MNLARFHEFVKSGYYWPTVAVVAGGIGIAVGVSVDRIFGENGEPEEGEACPEGEWDKEWDEPADRLPPIPEGVNEITRQEKVVEDRLFSKPDISKLVDYTKYSDKAKAYSADKDGDVVPVEFPDDTDAPEADDPRMEIIDEQEFMKATGNMDGYVSVTCGYFTQDGILAGWDEDMDEKDIGETVGWRAVRMFDSPDVKAVYVRNTHLKVLYEVVRYDDAYEEVLADAEQKSFESVGEGREK